MAFESKVAIVHVNQSETFRFQGTIQKYCVGFSKFFFKFPKGKKHKLSELSLNLQPKLNGSELTVTVDAKFKNDKGDTLDNSSYVHVVAIVMTDFGGDSVGMQNVYGVNQDNSQQVEVYGPSQYGEGLFVSGFNFDFGEGNHKFYRVLTAAYEGARDARALTVLGTAQTENDHDEINDKGTIDAGFLNAPETAQYFGVVNLGSFHFNSNVLINDLPAGFDWKYGMLVVGDFKVGTDKNDRQINSMIVGADYTFSGNTLTLTLVGAWCTPGNNDNAYSTVSLYAFAPALTA